MVLKLATATAERTLRRSLPLTLMAILSMTASAQNAPLRLVLPSPASPRAAAPAARTSVVPRTIPSRRSRGSWAYRGARRTSAVGRLGQLAQSAGVYRERDTRSYRLTEAPPGTYLAIQYETNGWYGVLMADGTTGWLQGHNVRLMDYQVVSTGGAPINRASGGEADIYPRSGAPYFTGNSQTLLAQAYKYLGVKYVWGGNTSSGIDCSGFVKQVFDACGYPLPRLGSDQMAYGVPVPQDQLQAGDRLYLGRRHDRVGVTHTGIYVGNGYFIHASSGRGGVAISNLSEPLYSRIYVCARR